MPFSFGQKADSEIAIQVAIPRALKINRPCLACTEALRDRDHDDPLIYLVEHERPEKGFAASKDALDATQLPSPRIVIPRGLYRHSKLMNKGTMPRQPAPCTAGVRWSPAPGQFRMHQRRLLCNMVRQLVVHNTTRIPDSPLT